jgi:CRISPR system Cascade subunit CasA
MNLLHDPVFTVDTSDGRETCSLPRIYALLDDDAVEGFTRLQAHQKQAWHCFLAQLGAIATEDRDVPDSEDGWRVALSALADEAAWSLYTEDLSKPAFMQPPVPEGTLEGFDKIHVTEYDVPVLSKNHALKTRRMHDPKPENWAYLLVNVQTTGFYSPGGRRTSRMNGSYGSRPFFGLTPSLRLGSWIMHDIQMLKRHIEEIGQYIVDFQREVTPLLWTVPWDGSKSIDLEKLHPLYIDCPRRIRQGEAWKKKSTATERVTGDVNGQTGDPWAPVNTNENKVLNPSRNAFEYRQLADILFGDTYRRPVSFKETTKGYVVCRAVTGEQGGRVHNLQRIIPFSNRRRGWDKIEEEAGTRIEKAGQAASVFSDALDWLFCEDVEEGPESGLMSAYKRQKRDEPEKPYDRQKNALHSRIDHRFFDRLFDAPDLDDAQRSQFWETVLVDALRAQWKDAKQLCPANDRWHRRARAQSVFDGRLRSEFTYAKQFTNNDEYDRTEGNGLGQPDGRAVADA